MTKEATARRFGPERWVTLRETGENVQVEAWSPIAAAYRVRSRKRGVFLAGEGELEELPEHPEAARGRHWTRCRGAGCGAPLTPELPVCEKCKQPTCFCGRCGCATARAAATKRPAKRKAAAKS